MIKKVLKLKPNIEISFDKDQEIWDETTYEITLMEKKDTIITEVKLPTRNKKNKPQDSSTKLF